MSPDDTAPAPPPQAEVEYRDVPGWPGYRVGADGSVWSSFTRVYLGRYGAPSATGGEWRRKKVSRGRKGYRNVALYHGGKERRLYVHSLVLMAFAGPCPAGMECRHLDGNPANNTFPNLCWGTKKENATDRVRHGHDGRGGSNSSAKLLEDDVRWVWLLSSWGHSHEAIARMLCVGSSTVRLVLRRSTWTHIEPPEGTDHA
jgi:hypothetical protein